MKDKYSFFKIITILILLTCGSVYYLIFTTRGSGFITHLLLSSYVDTKGINIRKIEGSFSKRLILHDIEADDLKLVPAGNKLEIQKLEVHFSSFSPKGLNIKIFNARLNLSQFDTILFYGNYQNTILNLTVYSNSVNIPAALDLFTEEVALKNLSGNLRNIDINIQGSFLEPKLFGGLQVESLSRNGFSLTNCPLNLNLQLKEIKRNLKLYGEILLRAGLVSGPKTAMVKLEESKILFKGKPDKPSFDLRGSAKVGDTKINISLKGTMDKPDLNLTSQPPMPQERLLIMLATNKKWEITEGAVSKGQLSPELAKDFLDYFVFSGSGSKIAQYLGISDFSLIFEKDKKGLGVKKALSDKIEASYTVEQSQEKEKQATVTQKIGGEYKVTDSISVGAEKELKQEDKAEQTKEKEKTDDKVFLKFKKDF